jgi:hypothetical protein
MSVLATGDLAAEAAPTVLDDRRKVDIEPPQRRRHVQPERAGVEPGAEVEHRSRAVRDGAFDRLVDQPGPHDQCPAQRLAERQRPQDRSAALARHAPRVRIVEEGVRPFRFDRPVHRDPEGGVGDVSDRTGRR